MNGKPMRPVIKRLIILQVILLAGLSIVFALPRSATMKPAALNTDLPNFISPSGWSGKKFGEASKEEREILAKDTRFFRRDYWREVSYSDKMEEAVKAKARGEPPILYPNLQDVLNAGIVLSGEDLSNSIHALERCLTAQGFNITQASTMHVELRTGQSLAVRRLVCNKAVMGSTRVINSISYYWFVGHDSTTSNHVTRGIKDFTDRIFKGYAQHWAYITITAQLDAMALDDPDGTGKNDVRALAGEQQQPVRRPLTEEKADALVSEFLGDLAPDIIRLDMIKEWQKE